MVGGRVLGAGVSGGGEDLLEAASRLAAADLRLRKRKSVDRKDCVLLEDTGSVIRIYNMLLVAEVCSHVASCVSHTGRGSTAETPSGSACM